MTKEELMEHLEYLMAEKWTGVECAEYLRSVFTYWPYHKSRAVDIIAAEVKSKREYEEHLFNEQQD
jgi:hypothetical protein